MRALAVAIALTTSLASPARADEAAPFWASPDPDSPLAAHAERIEVATVHAFGLMTQMRIGAAILWPEPFAETDLLTIAGRYGEALRQPPRWDPDAAPFEWDGDRWELNVLGHGAFGSELWLRARTCRASVLGALLFTAGHSAIWEYAFEGGSVRPSALDLWYTPAAGAVLGELRLAAWYGGTKLAPPWRQIVTAAVDPFGELERALGTPC